MRKLFTLAVIATAMMFVQTANAQVKFGLKAGVNLSSISLGDDLDKVADAKNRTGFFVGPTAIVTLPIVGLGLDGSILYDQREAKITAKGAQNLGVEAGSTLKMQEVVIPINVRYGFGLGSLASGFLFAGPQFGFNVGDKEKKLWENVADWEMKSANVSLNFGIGVMALNHLQITANYNLALGKNSELNVLGTGAEVLGLKKTDLKANAWQIGVAYLF